MAASGSWTALLIVGAYRKLDSVLEFWLSPKLQSYFGCRFLLEDLARWHCVDVQRPICFCILENVAAALILSSVYVNPLASMWSLCRLWEIQYTDHPSTSSRAKSRVSRYSCPFPWMSLLQWRSANARNDRSTREQQSNSDRDEPCCIHLGALPVSRLPVSEWSLIFLNLELISIEGIQHLRDAKGQVELVVAGHPAFPCIIAVDVTNIY